MWSTWSLLVVAVGVITLVVGVELEVYAQVFLV
jgi:hypothetical protein